MNEFPEFGKIYRAGDKIVVEIMSGKDGAI